MDGNKNKDKAKEANRRWRCANPDYQRKWRAAHREETREYARRWHAQNREKSRANSRRWYAANRAKSNARARKWQVEHPEEVKKSRRTDYLKGYGLTEMDFETMKTIQKNKCAICAEEFRKTPQVDHDHKTGEIRGLLCGRCNTHLASVEKPGWLSSALDYLKG